MISVRRLIATTGIAAMLVAFGFLGLQGISQAIAQVAVLTGTTERS